MNPKVTGLWKGVSDIFEMTGKRKIMAPAVEAIKFSYSAAALAQLKACCRSVDGQNERLL